MTFGENHKNLSVALAIRESSCLEAILFPLQIQKAKHALVWFGFFFFFFFISLSLTLVATGGEDSDVIRLGGERPLPSFIEERRVSMGRAHVFWRVKTEKKIKGQEFLLRGGRELKGGNT